MKNGLFQRTNKQKSEKSPASNAGETIILNNRLLLNSVNAYSFSVPAYSFKLNLTVNKSE